MSTLHTLLARQLRRFGLDPAATPPGPAFLAAVDAAYRAADDDRTHLERALEISSQELLAACADLQAVVRALPDLFLWFDREGRIVRMSGGADGRDPSFWPGRSAGALHDAAMAAALTEGLAQVCASGTMVCKEFQGDVPDRWYEARLVLLNNDQVLGVLRDISDGHRAAEALRRAKEAAEQAARTKADFLAMMSHEIRTPLNAIIGMNSLLTGTRLDPEQEDCVVTARLAGEALLVLINDVLDFSKLEAGAVVLESLSFPLRDCVNDVVTVLGYAARRKGLSLTCTIAADVPACVQGDPTRIKQVLTNLVANAIKFTERGVVAVDVVATELDRPTKILLFTVRDTGIGIAPDVGERLFHPFAQADQSTTRRFGGTGLGLAICKRLVERMGGAIGFESRPGVGTTFHFTLRVAAGATVAPGHDRPAVPASVAHGRERGRVLVVEDNVVNQKVAARMLDRLGLGVVVVGNAAAALDRLATEVFDVVLMDCDLPDMDGCAATAELRRRERAGGGGRRVPVVAFTANAVAENLQRCRAAGMDDHLLKPLRLADLAQAVDRWLRPGLVGAR